MRLASIVIVALLAGMALAQDGQAIRHPAARKALARAEQDQRKAEQVYRQELTRIQRTLIGELEQAKADAMKRQMLDEANAIQQAIDAARQELDRLEGKPVVQTFEIDAAQSWQPTVEVRAGQRIEIAARGQWCGNTASRASRTFGPDGIENIAKPYGWLEGKIGDGRAFRVGSSFSFVAEADGMLYLQMHDAIKSDNDGAISVRVRIFN